MTQYRKDNIRRSVWLVIDVPGMAAERIPSLEQAMRDFANGWIQEDRTKHFNDPYASKTGVAEAKKLRIFVEEHLPTRPTP